MSSVLRVLVAGAPWTAAVASVSSAAGDDSSAKRPVTARDDRGEDTERLDGHRLLTAP